MARRLVSQPTPELPVTEAALIALDAEDLRVLFREVLAWLDAPTSARLAGALIERAARNQSGWVPAGPADSAVEESLSFVAAATRVGHADPAAVDDYLRQACNAFLSRDYGSAGQLFHALLIPLGEADIDLGQHEMLDEVLGTDLEICTAQYVVSRYMTAPPPLRGQAVLSAIDEMCGVSELWKPLDEMERVAVEPLPEFAAFLGQWRGLLEERTARERKSAWGTAGDRWLREVVARLEGADGLARVARATARADDLNAWCRMLVGAKDWPAALAAYDEAAALVGDEPHWRGEFLDGAALATRELGGNDLPERLERAWREAPSLVRLRRWLGASGSTQVVRESAAAALAACPQPAQRQRALLHLLLGEFEAAATLLADALGLGWSGREHPGHLLFPLFCRLLGGDEPAADLARNLDEELLWTDEDEPHLATPTVRELYDLADVGAPQEGRVQTALLSALRNAAERRIAGVTQNKRRRHYAHAASLALACATAHPTPEGGAWLAAIRDQYRRYPALQRELARIAGQR